MTRLKRSSLERLLIFDVVTGIRLLVSQKVKSARQAATLTSSALMMKSELKTYVLSVLMVNKLV
jgi:hypothetical protein